MICGERTVLADDGIVTYTHQSDGFVGKVTDFFERDDARHSAKKAAAFKAEAEAKAEAKEAAKKAMAALDVASLQ
jgi:hypothetical protein